MPKLEWTNMVMIQDKDTDMVLVQDRIKSWKGWAFPGGHIEQDESFTDSAVREVREETGLEVKNLKSCGIVHWLNNETYDRYIVFLYKTTDYSGELISNCKEGRNFWATIKELENTTSQNNMIKYIPMFMDNGYTEAFCSWNKDESWELVYK